MTGYLLSVIGTVLICSLLTAIAPEGKTSSLIKGVARLGCILVIVAPALAFFTGGKLGKIGENFFDQSGIETDGSFIQYYSERRVQDAEAALEKEIEEKYGLQTQVNAEWSLVKEAFGSYSAEIVQIEKIRIVTPQRTGEEVKKAMREYVEKNYCSEVYIE